MARASILRNVTSRWQCHLATKALAWDPATPPFATSVRRLNIFTIFNKEAREKELLRLKDEMNRGYFDDLRELKKTAGKVAIASQNLVPVLAAGKFPRLQAYTTSGDVVSLPFENESITSTSKHVTLVCMAFRASAQSMIESWTQPFLETFASSASIDVVQVSAVDSWLLSLRPIKYLLLRSMRAPAIANGDQTLTKRIVYAFGDTYFFRKELGIPNLLAGYLFLLDNKGRVRWRASGVATAEELSSMVSCTLRLLEEDKSKPQNVSMT